MLTRRSLFLPLLLAACGASAPSGPQVQASIDGLERAGYACDAGTNTSHSDVITWSCSREAEGDDVSVTIESAGQDVRRIEAVTPRAAGVEAARDVLGEAIRSIGVGSAVEAAILGQLAGYEGGTVDVTVAGAAVALRGSETEVELTVELRP